MSYSGGEASFKRRVPESPPISSGCSLPVRGSIAMVSRLSILKTSWWSDTSGPAASKVQQRRRLAIRAFQYGQDEARDSSSLTFRKDAPRPVEFRLPSQGTRRVSLPSRSEELHPPSLQNRLLCSPILVDHLRLLSHSRRRFERERWHIEGGFDNR